MTKTLDAATQAAIAAGTVVPRDFVWITARDRTTGNPVSHGFWSDVGTVTAEVIDPITGAAAARQWEGAGGLIEVQDVPMSIGLQVNTVQIILSQIDPLAEEVIRGLDPRRARVEMFRGWLDPATMLLAAPAVARFVGFVDGASVLTPAEGADGAITLTVASYTQELTRSNSAKRSDADQRLRDAGDAFFQHVATVGDWEINWGIPDPPPEADA